MSSRFRVESLPIADLRRRLGEAIDRVEFDGERTLILRKGREAAALIPAADLDLLIRLLGEAEDRVDLAAAHAAAADDDGDLIPLEQLLSPQGAASR